jgi:hypothetical protein
MSNATTLASLARVTFGPFATASTVPAASVTGLGALATKSTVATTDLDNLAVTGDKIANDTITEAQLGTNEKRQIVRAFGYVDGSTGTLVSGFGLTTTRSGTGAYTVTLSTAAPNLNFTVIVTPRIASNLDITENSGTARTTTTTTLSGRNTSTNSAADVPFYSVAVLW